ncbi:MAG: DUF4835 family protein [Chlorobi bacterium]|nr:DUF4835 family protein [Chlorobiota bacterium]
MKHFLLTAAFFIISFQIFAQELNCRITIDRRQIQGSNEELFRAMQKDIFEFMNNRVWTNNVFSNNERIECQIQITLSKFNGIDKFTGTISVQSSRPVFNTNYKSTLFNYKENNSFDFYYTEGQALEFNENTHLSNLTSVLAFYAYIIIGLDYDSFGLNSGTIYFDKAKQIMNNAQSDPDNNWKAFGTRNQNNRFYLIQSITSSEDAPLRKFYYRYHRLGLDAMSDNLEAGRNQITNACQFLKQVYNRKANSYFLKIILTTKMDEIVKIFSEAPVQEKKKVYNILKEIDPTNSKVDKIMKTGQN